jgi:hypothetical protein
MIHLPPCGHNEFNEKKLKNMLKGKLGSRNSLMVMVNQFRLSTNLTPVSATNLNNDVKERKNIKETHSVMTLTFVDGTDFN